MSSPIPKPCRKPLVMISCVVDTTNMARKDASVYINAPIKPTCLRDNFFKAIFAENPETREKYIEINGGNSATAETGCKINRHIEV